MDLLKTCYLIAAFAQGCSIISFSLGLFLMDLLFNGLAKNLLFNCGVCARLFNYFVQFRIIFNGLAI